MLSSHPIPQMQGFIIPAGHTRVAHHVVNPAVWADGFELTQLRRIQIAV